LIKKKQGGVAYDYIIGTSGKLGTLNRLHIIAQFKYGNKFATPTTRTWSAQDWKQDADYPAPVFEQAMI
jgi:hypothetical protein